MKDINRLYMLRESLLDDVEVDEVEDNDSGYEEYVPVVLLFQRTDDYYEISTDVVDKIIRRFANFVSHGIIKMQSSDINWDDEYANMTVKFDIEKSNLNDYNFIKILMYVISCIKDDKIRIIVDSFGNCKFKPNMKMFFYFSSMFKRKRELMIRNISVFKDMIFPNSNGITVMKNIIQFGAKYGVLNSIEGTDDIYKIYTNYVDKNSNLVSDMNIINSKGYLLYSTDDTNYINFDSKYSFGLMKVYDYKEKAYNYIDLNGEYISNDFFADCEYFTEEGIAKVVKRDRKNEKQRWSIIDKTGKILTGDKYYNQIELIKNGYCYARKYSSYADIEILDKTGKNIFGDKSFASYKPIENGYGWVYVKTKDNEDGGLTLIDQNANMLYPDELFDNVYVQNEIPGMWKVFRNGKKNFFKSDGTFIRKKWIKEPCGDFCNGYAIVKSEKYGSTYIDLNGNVVCHNESGRTVWFKECYKFDKCGYGLVKKGNDNFNLVDKTGKLIFKDWFGLSSDMLRIFDKQDYFADEYILVRDFSIHKYKFLNVNDEILGGYLFDAARPFCNGFAIVRIDDYADVIDKNGKLMFGERKRKKYKIKNISNFNNGIAFIYNYSDDIMIIKEDGSFLSNDIFSSNGFIYGDVCLVKRINMSKKNQYNMNEVNFLKKDGSYVFDEWLDDDKCNINYLDGCSLVEYNHLFNVILADGSVLMDEWTNLPIVMDETGNFRIGTEIYVNSSRQLITLI